ncbi:MAG: 23S rRNA (guanosine(2251)-2'-O)-methyltransferase RlmB [Christensenellales bacterium]|jgi:23S rRNA (guanosine2251-2'-O)-methyltransferase
MKNDRPKRPRAGMASKSAGARGRSPRGAKPDAAGARSRTPISSSRPRKPAYNDAQPPGSFAERRPDEAPGYADDTWADDDAVYQLEGKNPVWEALKAGQAIDKLIIDSALDDASIAGILGAARRMKVHIERAPRPKLDALARTGFHQGLIAMLPAASYIPLDELLDQAFVTRPDPVFVLLDEMQDPHNVGAIIRSAECAGASGVILTERRSAGLTATVARSSAGAVAHIPICRVTNLVAAIDAMKLRGVWVRGADMDAPPCYNERLTGPLALVIGNEAVGLRRLVRERCDSLIGIPMRGRTGSLNASVAAGVLLFEAVRQRMREEMI